eukprot:TRINITY_DN5394_c0_g1_i1.p1 TRINITY_DN5394_c0_g1~~TRINITY_DN5394_c0_g1_i1.p1  ORF type:complete len:447 (-),score=94.23 TRINITY_DN5394_c0_g1_i1:51-1391(-)
MYAKKRKRRNTLDTHDSPEQIKKRSQNRTEHRERKRSKSPFGSRRHRKKASAFNTNLSPNNGVVLAKGRMRSKSPSGRRRRRSNKQSEFEYIYDDLPISVRKKIEKSKLDMQLVHSNLPIIFSISYFLFKEKFVKRPFPDNQLPDTLYCTEEMIERATDEVKDPPKSVKKMYKKLISEGKGGFGEVYGAKSQLKDHKGKVAIKKVPHLEEDHINNYCEIAFMLYSDSPYLVDYICSWHIGDEVWIIMELLEGGTLSAAAKVHVFSDNHMAYIARESAKGVQYIHSLNWVHRDLKSVNIMMTITGKIKLIDFGLCAVFNDGPRQRMLGSPYWVPPEMIRNEPHSYPADIWSLGVCLLELYLQKPPHALYPIKCMFEVATIGLMHLIPDSVQGTARNFMEMCLTVDQYERATADQLVEHEWVNRRNIEVDLGNTVRDIFFQQNVSSMF